MKAADTMTFYHPLPPELAGQGDEKWTLFLTAAQAADLEPPAGQALVASARDVFAASTFVAQACCKNPQVLVDLVQSGDLQAPAGDSYYSQRLQAHLKSLDAPSQLSAKLRLFRRREMIRIAWRDLAGWSDLNTTTADLTALAETCLQQALAYLYRRHCDKWGTPTDTAGQPQQMVVIAMGKLGAWELNFSSDIDLLFAYPNTGVTQNGPRELTNEEFFTRLGRELIQTIGAQTADGFVFRVDMRLRPYGDSGPLVMSFDSLETYYQSQGREWERYAWIKARPVAGDLEAGRELLAMLKPFIYRRYLDFGAFDSLRAMKQMIMQEVKRRDMQDHIKLGAGGIREIEFFGQMFQLIRGGVLPDLQARRIRHVLDLLAREGLAPPVACRELTAAYIFLRHTEHRLQAHADQQTHTLPTGELSRLRLAAAMGYADWDTFHQQLQAHRDRVHRHFAELLQTDTGRDKTASPSPAEAGDIRLADLGAVWHQRVDKSKGCELLAQAGFKLTDKAWQLIDHLKNDQRTRTMSAEGQERLGRLVPILLAQVGQSEEPAVALGRIIDLIRTIQQRTAYLALLLENPPAVAHLVKLATASSWIVTFLAKHPVLLDELLDPRTLYVPPERDEMVDTLHRRLQRTDPDDLEQQIEALCIFKQVHILRVAAADITGAMPLMRVSDYLSAIAEIVLDAVFDMAWQHLAAKHGTAQCRLTGHTCERGFAVIAYGKLGGLELGYGSDLDLVFLHAGTPGQTQGGARPIDTPQFFARLGQRVIHILTAHTRAGALYEVDMRLRPSGSSGVLVSHIDAFADYQRNEAWTWEHQALLKARPIAGDPALARQFEHIRAATLGRKRAHAQLRREVRQMRAKMRRTRLEKKDGWFDIKEDFGGLIDIEFLVQYLVLGHAHRFAALQQWTDNVRLLQALAETGVIDTSIAHYLRRAYLIYRSVIHRKSLQQLAARVDTEFYRNFQQTVQRIWEQILKSKEEKSEV